MDTLKNTISIFSFLVSGIEKCLDHTLTVLIDSVTDIFCMTTYYVCNKVMHMFMCLLYDLNLTGNIFK